MRRPAVLVLLSAPALLLAVAWAGVTVLGVWGMNPIWQVEPLNLSEAAALRDRGEVAWLLEAGADPTAVETVRGGFLYESGTALTPLDAAVLADRPEIVQLLFDYGLTPDPAAWTRAWCAAAAGSQVRALLETARPQHAPKAAAAELVNACTTEPR